MAGSPETGRYALCVETVVLSLKHPRELGPRLFDHIQLCLICDGRLAVSPRTGMQSLPVALPGNTWAGEGDPGCVRTALNRT